MAKKNISKEWAELCAKSNGGMVPLPDELIELADEQIKQTKEYREAAMAFDKVTATMETNMKVFWHKVREALEAKGVKGPFSKNIGWNQEALEHGQKIINITEVRG